MKKLLLVTLVAIMLVPGASMANPLPWGPVGFYAAPNRDAHYIYDNVAGTIMVYVLIEMGPLRAVRFAAPPPPCFVATYVGESTPFEAVGNSQTGIIIDMGTCLNETIHILTMEFQTFGLTEECCLYWPMPHPDHPEYVDIYSCQNEWVIAYGGPVIINPDPPTLCGTIPVGESTWGKIKSLYQ